MQEASIVAPATPRGESALAVIRVSGPRARDLAATCHGGRVPPPRRLWHADYRSSDGRVIDDVVFCFFAGPKSYTGEDLLEISCHGNPLLVARIIDDLVERGCRLAEPGEFTRRAFLNGRLDLTAAEAVMDLIRARSDRALEVARRQLRGALRERIERAMDRLLDLSAAVEAHVDFPEEDLPPAERGAWLAGTMALREELRRLADTRRTGDRLRDGCRVVLAGAPNAGKSSLLNRLVGFDRAIVSPEPGTTRDFVEEQVTLDGQCMRIVDTAGLREDASGVERAGVERTLACLREADIVVLVVDGVQPVPELPAAAGARLSGRDVVVVASKADLGPRRWERAPGITRPPIDVSALSGQGMDTLRRALADAIRSWEGATADDQDVVVNARHEECLRAATAALDRACAVLESGTALELAGVDLREAREALGGIVGQVDHEQVLDRIFAAFCIGK